MKYFFVLGTNCALSVAELQAVLNLTKVQLVAPDFLLWETDHEINPEKLINSLGGIIKIGLIKKELAQSTDQQLLAAIIEEAASKKSQSKEGKFNFGFSDYGEKKFNKKFLGLELKKYFSNQEISSRFVVSQEKTLSSVVVAQNKLLTRGLEIILAEHSGVTLIGETLAVQPFKDLSRRDFGRPARDDFSGMLPPKLAQIMINLAQAQQVDGLLVDPFCGSGTILSEALLAGYKNLFGSDIALKAIEDTRKNISWLKELYKIEGFHLKLLVKNVVYLSKFIKNDSVVAIITEPYLGPQRGNLDFKLVIGELERLYSAALREFYKVLQPGGRVVMVWPVYLGQKSLNPDYSNFKLVNLFPDSLDGHQYIKKTDRGTIIYGRVGQKVFREIVVLEK